MDHLPIFLDVRGKKIVVTGGGGVAARKTEMALRAGARVTVFAAELGQEFRAELTAHANFSFKRGFPGPDDLAGAIVAYGGEENYEKDKRLYELAKGAGVLANVADTVDLCDFISPAIFDRSPLIAAISSSGASPLLTRVIKAQLESAIPAGFGELSAFMGGFREEAGRRIGDPVQRRRFWEDVIEGPVASRFLAGDAAGARAALMAKLEAASGGAAAHAQTGEVYLVGAGPGDPDLLTFRAHRLMQRADVALYDRLIGPRILNLVRRDAERIYVGKEPQDHTLAQGDISRMLVRLAKEGKRVLRLKGGDPFIFGRGGEEIEELAKEGIPFQVVPGVTAAAGCAAYAGIPLTHRDHAQTCVFVTGHGKDGKLDLNWDALLQPRQTIAVYMGLSSIGKLMQEFLARGMRADMPAAVIDNGTRQRQRVVTGALADIAAKTQAAALKGPAIIIIGTVVTLRDKLQWFTAGDKALVQPGSGPALAAE